MKVSTLLYAVGWLLVLAMSAVLTNSYAQVSRQESVAKTAEKKTVSTAASDGQRKFEIHCGRCHNPPHELSPKAVPAVLRHMRVRAMLTEEDEKAILDYIGQ